MTELSDSIVLVTGAARGIGRALTNGFLHEGAAVIAVDRDPGGVEPFDEPDPRRLLTVAADVTDSTSIAAARDAALDRFGRVDVVVSNAALRQRSLFEPTGLSTVLDASDADWRAMFEVNVLGTLTVIRRFVPLLIGAGGGSIIAIGTIGAMTQSVTPGVWQASRSAGLNQPYEASKSALASMILSLAEELRGHDIAANVLIPGPTMTTGSAEMAAARAATGFVNPPYLRPEHIVPAALHLAAQRGGTGQTASAIDAVAWNDEHGLGGPDLWHADTTPDHG
ncbi:SDR family NAD(P)-dependent oxidoreductase [Pseudonocardia sp. CA-142604]|uniref:SDR family NAD(P)-dependent oxidoreductase n=1 Tax=Pseudonocardia sp. CA-142604 TaxID=3240024 RepID=UPI003D94ADD3